jgi:hypothetical protein
VAELTWDKTDFLVCLGVLPEIEDYETSFLYRVERLDLVLSIVMRPYESIVELQLQRTGSKLNLLDLVFLSTGGNVVYKCEKWGNYLQFPDCRVVTNRFYDRSERGVMSFDRQTSIDIEIAVDPDIRIDCGR